MGIPTGKCSLINIKIEPWNCMRSAWKLCLWSNIQPGSCLVAANIVWFLPISYVIFNPNVTGSVCIVLTQCGSQTICNEFERWGQNGPSLWRQLHVKPLQQTPTVPLFSRSCQSTWEVITFVPRRKWSTLPLCSSGWRSTVTKARSPRFPRCWRSWFPPTSWRPCLKTSGKRWEDQAGSGGVDGLYRFRDVKEFRDRQRGICSPLDLLLSVVVLGAKLETSMAALKKMFIGVFLVW